MIPLHLQTLYREHRSIAAVLSALEHLVGGIESRGERVDPKLFQAILHYLEVVPERVHHPKEESCLFAAIKARTHEADEVLAELQRQHEHGGAAIKSLERAFAEHHDPIEATDDPKALLHQILMLAPPPIGIGSATR